MTNRTLAGVATFLMCVGAAAGVPGCSADDAPESFASAAVTCTTVGSTWWNSSFPNQTGKFVVEFDATPSGPNIDAVVGVSAAPATGFSSLAAIVRFNAQGGLDARSGGQYVTTNLTYQAGVTYHFQMNVDLSTHKYSALFRVGNGDYNIIGYGLAFRTEQAGVTHLANVGSVLDSPGSLSVCGITVRTDPTDSNGCITASAGQGFVNIPADDATVLDTYLFTATPSTGNIDAVVGMSAGPATAFNSLATAVRFNPSGVMDARDGDTYRADASMPYKASQAMSVREIADVTVHTFSAVVSPNTYDNTVLATQYRFRTQQASITHLNNVALIVDSSAGSLTVCRQAGPNPSRGVSYAREGGRGVAPFSGGAFLTDGTTTTKVDTHGTVLASVARSGMLGTDSSGNAYVVNVSGTSLTVEKLDPSLVSQWVSSDQVLDGTGLASIGVDASGAITVGWVNSQYDYIGISRFSAAGASLGSGVASGEAIAIDGSNYIYTWNNNGTFWVTKRDVNGAIVWQRSFTGGASVSQLAPVSDGGVVFGGALQTEMDFGGGTLRTEQTENGAMNGFVVRLGGNGQHIFSQNTWYNWVGSVATNSKHVVLSGYQIGARYISKFEELDMNGAPATDVPGFVTGFGEYGFGSSVSIAPDEHVYWNMEGIWGCCSSSTYLLAI